MLENQVGKMGFGPLRAQPCTLVQCLCYGFCFSWGTLDVKIICIFYCIIWSWASLWGGGGRKTKQTNNGDPLFCDDAVMIKFEAFFETAVLGINQSMCQSDVPLTFL
ncbi:unnamed protein product [Pipistrellus nathusii]|uniref:Uncharacterized protein n=1 Tax=Pipistrellus nathusii TaxID=59473 RepID=A0ABP0A849_PIPNA